MKYGMDDFHTVRLKAFFMNQRQVKSLDVTILDIGQLHVSDFISDILIIHVLIVSSGRFLDLNLLAIYRSKWPFKVVRSASCVCIPSSRSLRIRFSIERSDSLHLLPDGIRSVSTSFQLYTLFSLPLFIIIPVLILAIAAL